MEQQEFQEYIKQIAQQCAVSYSKTARRDEEDFKKLLEVLEKEMTLGFQHLLT